MPDPIKNSLFGANTALEFVQDVYDILSNPQMQEVFDRKRFVLQNIEDIPYTRDEEKS